MARLTKKDEKFILEMSEDEIRNLIGSLNSGYSGIPVETQKRWARFLHGHRDRRMVWSALIGAPTDVPWITIESQ